MNSYEWIYNGDHYKKGSYISIKDFPDNCFGFIYLISNKESGTYYVGKKYLFHNIKRKIGKKEKQLIEGKGRKPSFEVIQKESDWKTYWSSSKQLQQMVKEQGPEKFSRTIIDFAFNKKHLTFLELKYQFIYGVLEDPYSLNDNILGKFYKKDFSSQN